MKNTWLALLACSLPSLAWTQSELDIQLKQENMVEACIASMLIAGDQDEADHWVTSYGVDLQALAIYQTVLEHMIKTDQLTMDDVKLAVRDCVAARKQEESDAHRAE